MRDRLELRAREYVANGLLRLLIVPRIYFDAEWPAITGGRVDVLAIDRDGVGDTHLVQIRRQAADALALIPSLLGARAPFRWIAFLRGTEDEATMASLASQEILYAPDTGGRIGIIEVVEMTGGDLGANVRIKAERFPTPVYDVATAFANAHKADIQFGG